MQCFIENGCKLPRFWWWPLGNALKDHRNSFWEMLKGSGKLLENIWSYLLAFGQFWKAIRKLLRNGQIKLILAGQTFLLTGRERKKKFGNWGRLLKGDKAELPCSYWQKHGNSIHFLWNTLFLYRTWYMYIKDVSKNFKKPSAAPLQTIYYQIIPLLGRLRLVQQSF